MKFDRKAPGGGAEAICRLENGKAFLEWRFYFQENEHLRTAPSSCICTADNRPEQVLIKVSVTDENGNTAAECICTMEEEEALETILMQPCLWQGIQNPFRYKVRADLVQNGKILDSLGMRLPLRMMETGKDGELLLNQRPFTPRAVRYTIPAGSSALTCQKLVLEDFQRLLKLGANCICADGKEFQESSRFSEDFWQLCDRFGFLLFLPGKDEALTELNEKPDLPEIAPKPFWVCAWNPDIRLHRGEELPLFRGEADSLFTQEDSRPASLYDQYRAEWSKEPFIHIVPESLVRLKSGNYTVTCYSNCSKTALYSDGILFEFREGKGELVFQEVPAKGPCIRLSAEGDGVSTSYSVHKSFTNHNITIRN